MRRKAFTLIELLVVIAIIAILAAILFPVFAKAKDAAKKTQSVSNQKQIATGVMIYMSDYDDVYPMSAYIKAPVAPDPRPVVFSIYDALMPYTKNNQLFVSPANNPGHNWRTRLHALNLTNAGPVEYASYIPNLGLFGENFCTPIFPAPLRRYTPTFNGTSLDNPAGTIMLFDGYIKENVPLEYNNFMAQARHGEIVVINWADGHTSAHRYNGIPNGGQIPNPAWIPAGSTRTTYYSWSPGELLYLDGDLQNAPNTYAAPYNDLHGVPGSRITDSEDTGCPAI